MFSKSPAEYLIIYWIHNYISDISLPLSILSNITTWFAIKALKTYQISKVITGVYVFLVWISLFCSGNGKFWLQSALEPQEHPTEKPCMFSCQKCCFKCNCVPPETYGQNEVCPSYNNWKTKRGGPKCPWKWKYCYAYFHFFFHWQFAATTKSVLSCLCLKLLIILLICSCWCQFG